MAETEGDEEWAEGDMLDAAETLAAETFIRNLVEGGEDKEGTPNSADDGQDKLDVDPLADEEAIHPAEIHILDDSNESTSSSDAEEDSIDEEPVIKRKKKAKKAQQTNLKSSVHKHFEKCPSEGPFARKCLLCPRVYQNKSGTSNLWDHLNRAHPKVYKAAKAKTASKTPPKDTDEPGEDADKTSGVPEKAITLESFNFTCMKRKKSAKETTLKLSSHPSTPSDKEKNVDYNLYQLLVHLEDGNVNILHNLFFLNIVKLASHHYKCPANENEVQSGVVRRAESMKELLQAELKKLTHYTLNVSIACDEKQEKYLVVGITYFDESVEEVASANLSLCKLQILYDTVDIEEVEQSVKKTLAKWELAQPTAIVVGMEEDMYDTVGFWRTLKVPTFVCFREAMLEIEKSMTSFVYNLNVIANVKNLQDYFDEASKSILLPNPSLLLDLKQDNLKMYISTAKKLATDFQMTLWLHKDANAPPALEASELEDLKIIETFVNSLHNLMNEISTLGPILSSEALNYRASFLAEFDRNSTEDLLSKILAEESKKILISKTKTDYRHELCSATMLDPRTRNISWLSDEDRQMAIRKLDRSLLSERTAAGSSALSTSEGGISLRQRNAERLRFHPPESRTSEFGRSVKMKAFLDEGDRNLEDTFWEYWKERKACPFYKHAVRIRSFYVSSANPQKVIVSKGLEKVRAEVIFLRQLPQQIWNQ